MTDPTKILAIETATSNCSVALQCGELMYERSQTGNNIHSQVLLEMVQDVLHEGGLKALDIDAVAVGQGPGSFTGLRIGVGVAQGIAYGANCPMIGVSSLAALVAQAQIKKQMPVNSTVLAAIDARMNEVYWGVFKANLEPELLGSLNVSAPEKIGFPISHVLNDSEKMYLVGNAWSEYQHDFDAALLRQAEQIKECFFPLATGVLVIAEKMYLSQKFVSPIEFAPTYVRNNVAKKKLPNS